MPYGGIDVARPPTWPTTLTEDEFRERFRGESATIEFKQGITSLQDSIVAFSNTGGGVIVAGVANDGRVVGLPFTPAAEDRINDEAASTHSPGVIRTAGLSVGEHSVTIIGVERLREGFAQTSSGRVLVRVGTKRKALIGSRLVQFMHERAASTFESAPTDIELHEASPFLVEEVADALAITDRAKLTGRLADRGLVAREDGREVLTVAGTLYLTERPDRVLGKAYVEILRFADDGPDFDLRQEYGGPLHRQVVEVTRSLMTHLGSDSVVLGLRRHDLPRIPERVIREAIANAVAHRSYEQRGTPVRVEVRPDRVVITSPGGLIAPVTLDTMRDAYAARNNDVIRVLRAFALAEDSGKGVDIIQDLMRDELLAAPRFTATEGSVSVALPVLAGTRPQERAWVREIVERGTIEDRDRILLVHARRGETLTNQRARELLNTGRDGAVAALRRLVDAGLLERSGQRGGTRYQLVAALAPPAGLKLNRSQLRDLLVEMAGEGPLTNQIVRGRTGLDRQDVLSLFDELVADGVLLREGERRGSRYVVPEG